MRVQRFHLKKIRTHATHFYHQIRRSSSAGGEGAELDAPSSPGSSETPPNAERIPANDFITLARSPGKLDKICAASSSSDCAAAACAAAPRGGRERTSGAGSDGAVAAAAASSILARAAAVARYASCSDPCDAADGLCGTFSKRVFITPLASAADMLSGRRLIGRPPTLAGRGLQRSDPPDPQEPAL